MAAIIPQYDIGDIVEMKKPHPCGSNQWEITRVGMDFKLRCLGCQHQIMLPRAKFEKGVKQVVRCQDAIEKK